MTWIQCNSEHSRHWVFHTPIITESGTSTLLDMIKSTLYYKSPNASSNTSSIPITNSLIAFCDNSSAITGFTSNILVSTFQDQENSSQSIHSQSIHSQSIHSQSNPNNFIFTSIESLCHPCLTAETHNYPTYYHPFQGAATGEGGRIRDSLATCRGSISSASLIGYSINNIVLLKDASNGASDYANKQGEPCIGGFLRWHLFFEKPIMFSAGVGFLKDTHLYSPEYAPSPGDYLIKIGSPAMKIGFGGSIMSSVSNNSADTDMTAIQRGDPYNANKVTRFLEYLALLEKPLIKKIHDQGAGGLANVVTELLDGWDCEIDISILPQAMGMNPLECWLSEYQEQMVCICPASNYPILESLASREGVLIHTLGTILPTHESRIFFKNYTYHYNRISNDYNINYHSSILQTIAEQSNTEQWNTEQSNKEQSNRQEYLESIKALFQNYHSCSNSNDLEKSDITGCHESLLERSFKSHLTNKIDRSVTGCIVQQSCIGAYSIPLSNYSITRLSPLSQNGILSAIGENIFVGQSISHWIDKTICELLANLAGVPHLELHKIKLSGNWMLNAKSVECMFILYEGIKYLTQRLKSLNLAIDGGKDSLSMSMETPNGTITSPPSLVLTSYSVILEADIQSRVSPLLNKTTTTPTTKNPTTIEPFNLEPLHTLLYYIDILELMNADIQSTQFLEEWNNLQAYSNQNIILALHDGSNVHDILEEMAVVSGIGIEISRNQLTKLSNNCIFQHHYIVIQINQEHTNKLTSYWHYLGKTSKDNFITYLETTEFIPLETIFKERNKLSQQLDISKIPYELQYQPMTYKWPNINNFTITKMRSQFDNNTLNNNINKQLKIAIIRDEGSNSHREMASAFLQFANVICYDITMNELITNAEDNQKRLLACNGLVFVGGFAYGDILGSGRATALIMRHRLGSLFDTIFQDPSKFVLGVCNGCQILIEYRLMGDKVSMTYNKSGKFESRWLPVKYKTPITNTDSQLGIWIAHGEGRFCLKDGWMDELDIIGTYSSHHYPYNPNGSSHDVIGLKSTKAKHYVIMPHPERSLFKWQCEWIPEKEKNRYPGNYTPWIEFFYELLLTCSQ